MNKAIIISLSILICGIASGQQEYELLFLQGEFEQILQKSSALNSPEDYYWNGMILNKLGKTAEAIRILENGLERYEEDRQIELLVSDLYFSNGQFPKAKPLLVKHQDLPGKFVQLIEILEFERNYTEVIRLLDEKLMEDSLNTRYLIHMGDNYFQQDSLKKATRYFEKAFQINPEDQETAKKLANIHLKMKQYERTLEICDQILENDSTNKAFIRIKGMASFNLDDYETARDCFLYLLLKGDSSYFILKHLGISELNNMQWHIGRDHLLQAFRLDSNDFETCFFLGRSFLNSPTQETGLHYLDRADSLLRPDPKVRAALYIEKQSIYAVMNRYDKALECYMAAYKLNPRAEYLFYTASVYEYGLKDKRKALEYYELFLSVLPPKTVSVQQQEKGQITVSLRKAAETAIARIKEELFFEGEGRND